MGRDILLVNWGEKVTLPITPDGIAPGRMKTTLLALPSNF